MSIWGPNKSTIVDIGSSNVAVPKVVVKATAESTSLYRPRLLLRSMVPLGVILISSTHRGDIDWRRRRLLSSLDGVGKSLN